MVKRFIISIFFILICAKSYGATSDTLNIREADGSPDTYPFQLKVSNGTLTDNGDGTVNLSGGGASIGGAVTSGIANSVLYIEPTATLSQDASNFTYDVSLRTLTITSFNDAILTLSGSSGANSTAGIGRTAIEGRWAIPASNNQYAVGAVAGDFVVRNDDSTKAAFFGAGGTSQVIARDISTQLGSSLFFYDNNNLLAISRDAGQSGIAIAISSDNGTTVLASISHDGGATFNSLTLANKLSVDSGGTGAVTHTDGGVLIGKGTAALANTGVLAKGTLIVGDGVTNPTTLTVGSMGQILSVDTGATSGLAWVASPGGAPTDADYLVGTANGSLSAEIAVGTTPGGELGNTWASPTIDDSLAVTSWNLTTPTITTQFTLTAQATPTTDADGEVALDTDGWGTGFDAYEAFNGTASAYFVATTASDTPTNGQVPKWNTGGEITWEADADSGGATAWSAIGDAAGAGEVAMAETVQTLDWNTAAVSSLAITGLSLTYTNDAAADVLSQTLFRVANLAGANGIEVLQEIGNDDADDVATTGLLFTSGAGAMTTAIEASDAEIGTALSVGANDITGSTGLINYTNFDVDAAGAITGNTLTVTNEANITGTPDAAGDVGYDTTQKMTTVYGGATGAVSPVHATLVSSVGTETFTNSTTNDQPFTTIYTFPANSIFTNKVYLLVANVEFVTGVSTATVTLFVQLGGADAYRAAATTDLTNSVTRSAAFSFVISGKAAAGAAANVTTMPLTSNIGGAAAFNGTNQPVAFATNGTLALTFGIDYGATGSTETIELQSWQLWELN